MSHKYLYIIWGIAMICFCFGADRGAHWKTAGSFVVAKRHKAGRTRSLGSIAFGPSQPGSSSPDHSGVGFRRDQSQHSPMTGSSNPTVCHWRKKWFDQGLVGLYGEARPGRPRTHDEEQVAELLRTVLDSKPADATHWTVRSAAATTGLSKSTVARTFALFGVQPHRSKHFKLSTDPEFVDKVRDIVGLYLNPPDHALVLCVDEKTQIQALERSQPILPLGLGYIEGVTHDLYGDVAVKG